MKEKNTAAFILGAFLCVGILISTVILSNTILRYKSYERSVVVKGLAEQEHLADIVIWPIRFSEADNDLASLYQSLEKNTQSIVSFLKESGFSDEEISFSAPEITDKSAQQWGNAQTVPYRYTAEQTVTVYSTKVLEVQEMMSKLSVLGKKGIVFTGGYNAMPEYIFTKLNDIKPEMIEDATGNAREVAEKFAKDSHSVLGKIKTASQGLFSISQRDKNNPQIKQVRVVSTVEYYLSD
jgi:hypothetical protein